MSYSSWSRRRRPGRWSRRRRLRLARTAALALALVVLGAIAAHASGSGSSRGGRGRGAAGAATGTRPAGRRVGAPGSTTSSTDGDGQAVTLAFGGDVHFEGPLQSRLADDASTALSPVATLLEGSDLSMVNLESAVTSGGCPQPQAKQYVFFAPPTAYQALRGAGVTVVTEANNHGEDCGPEGLQQTLAAARAAGFPVIGLGRNAAEAFAPFRATIKGQRIAIIAATDVLDSNLATAWTATSTQAGLASAQNDADLLAAVRAAAADSDTVVVYLHWGTETETCPNAAQPPLAEALVAAGATIVVGAHAHVQLGAGYLGQSFVDYGLGNLAFYDSSAPEDYSGVLDVTVTGHRIDAYRWVPAIIDDGEPAALSGAGATQAQQRWLALRSCTNLAASPS